MYIATKKHNIAVITRGDKLYAPVVIHGFDVMLKLYSAKGKSPNVTLNRGNLPPLTNNSIFKESIRRIEYLVSYIGDEKIKSFFELPARISGVDYMSEERRTAMRITSMLRGL